LIVISPETAPLALEDAAPTGISYVVEYEYKPFWIAPTVTVFPAGTITSSPLKLILKDPAAMFLNITLLSNWDEHPFKNRNASKKNGKYFIYLIIIETSFEVLYVIPIRT
jgi:hypothetical protein